MVAIVGVVIALVQKGAFAGAGTGVGTAISSSANARLDNASTGNQISINNGNQV